MKVACISVCVERASTSSVRLEKLNLLVLLMKEKREERIEGTKEE